MLVASNVPIGKGLSSSASLEIDHWMVRFSTTIPVRVRIRKAAPTSRSPRSPIPTGMVGCFSRLRGGFLGAAVGRRLPPLALRAVIVVVGLVAVAAILAG